MSSHLKHSVHFIDIFLLLVLMTVCGRGGKALDMGLSGGSEVRSRSGAIKRFIKSQVRVGLGILTDLNRHLPRNVTTMTTHPLIGETRSVHSY